MSQKKKRSTSTSYVPEDITFLPEEQRAYDAAIAVLTRNDTFFAPFPSLVKIQTISSFVGETGTSRELMPGSSDLGLGLGLGNSLISNTQSRMSQLINHTVPNTEFVSKDYFEFDRALGKLEELEKEEPSLIGKTPITKQLTEIVTGDSYQDSLDAITRLEMLGRAVPRRVCQHPFKKNDIVWVCRTCQADETCVLCHACFSQSNHEGHDVAFYHAQAGGCCGK